MSTIKERVEDVLSRPMDRGQFIKSVGVLLLAAVGVTSLLNTLEGGRPRQGVGDAGGSAYGSSAYAGGKKPV